MILFLITTYNRPALLLGLLQDIAKIPDIRVKIYNDGSTEDYRGVQEWAYFNLKDYRWRDMKIRHGREKYWQLNNLMFQELRSEKFDYVIQLPDDVRLAPGFKNAPLYLDQADLDVLNILTLQRVRWTQKYTINGVGYWKAEWVDGCYVAKRRFFEALNYSVPPVPASRFTDKRKSTGVGNAITAECINKGVRMGQLQKSLVITHRNESKLRPGYGDYYKVNL